MPLIPLFLQAAVAAVIRRVSRNIAAVMNRRNHARSHTARPHRSPHRLYRKRR